MLTALLVAQVLTLAMVGFLLSRRSRAAEADPRLAQLPELLIRHEARLEGLEGNLRAGLSELNQTLRSELTQHRNEATANAGAVRDAHTETARLLRDEVAQSVQHLSMTLSHGLDGFRGDHRVAAETLKGAVGGDLATIQQRLANFFGETSRAQIDAREALHTRLTGLETASVQHQEKLRATVGESLDKLNTDNSAKLEAMRQTVDEKLQATLHTRLTESFGQVTDQLNKVHTGLGEMTKLSAGVDDLSRIFTNVKSRGGFAEVQLGMLLEQMLAPSQFVRNARVKPGTLEVVEFAVRFPGHTGETLLPIDAKFPREAWERLETAYGANDQQMLAVAGKAFEAAIRAEGERICRKYINPPTTTPHAIMFLPTEGLYAEVMRRDALQAEIQSKCQVTIAGPSTLSAILTSFQMGFHMLALQEKGDEVWKVLEATKTEFGKFGGLMEKVEKQVGTVQNTLREIGGKTTTINRTLKAVSDPVSGGGQTIAFEDFSGIAPRLAAVGDED